MDLEGSTYEKVDVGFTEVSKMLEDLDAVSNCC